VNVPAGDYMIPAFQQHGHAVRRRHARREGERAAAPFKRSERGFKRTSRGVSTTGIIVFTPITGSRLDERGRQMQRWNHGPGLRIVGVADMNGSGAKLHGVYSR